MDLDLFLNDNLQGLLNRNEAEENIGATDLDNLNKYIRRNRYTNEDVQKASKGLKSNNPSQRNHSSVYE
jgi:hypothetical protein